MCRETNFLNSPGARDKDLIDDARRLMTDASRRQRQSVVVVVVKFAQSFRTDPQREVICNR